MQLLVESKNEIIDFSELVTELSWTDQLNNGASYIEFSYLNRGYSIDRGDVVRMIDENGSYFVGIIFKTEIDEKKIVKVKAYDRLRYCKAKDTIAVDGETVAQMVSRMCSFFSFPTGTLEDSGYALTPKIHTDKTWLDIIYDGIKDALVSTQKYYCLRDEYGLICIRDIESLQLNLILGDRSMAYGYSYSSSIDDEFYNQVKLVSGNETTGKADVYEVFDSNSISKYGLLQYYEVLGNNSENATSKAEALLKLYNRELETLNFKCLGDLRIRAGSSFYATVEDINLNRRVIVNKVTHKFLPAHTMDIEVMAS